MFHPFLVQYVSLRDEFAIGRHYPLHFPPMQSHIPVSGFLKKRKIVHQLLFLQLFGVNKE
jgi:hypothetical protein